MKRSVIDKAEPSNPPVHDGEGRRQHLGIGGDTGGGPGGGTGGPAGKARLAAAAAVLAAAIFAGDLSLPLGVAGGVPYVVVVLLGWWFGSPRAVFALAAICTILTALGYLFSPAGGIAWIVLVNRALALAAIWVTAVLVNHAKSSEALVALRTAELRASESQIRTIADNVPVLISYVGTDRRYIFNNRTYKDWFGLSPEELTGRHLNDVLGDAACEICEPYILRTLAGETVSYQADLPYVHGKARSVQASHVPDFDEAGTVKGFFTIINDITEQKRAEKLLRDAIEVLPVGFAIYGRDERLTLCNELYREYFFHHLDAVPLGTTFEDILRDKLGRDHYHVTEERRDEWLAERLGFHRNPTGPLEQRHSNGHWYWINEHRTDEGGIVVVVSDITERKRLEAEVLRQERLATLGQLTATVSHELRNPLGVIRTSAYIVNSGLDDPDPRILNAIARIERSVVRCDRIIDELLDFTHISELDPTPTPLNSWLGRTLAEQHLPPGVELRLNFGNDATTAALDHDRFRRAVINVFDNACQAMTNPDSQNRDTKDSVLSVTTQVSGDRIEIVFEDNGAGIAADVRPMIFEPLFSTKGFGVGLGLSVVRQIMDQHGGGIEIDSQPGRGTRVCLWLPNTDDPLSYDRPAS